MDHQFDNISVLTRTRTRSDVPEPLVTLRVGVEGSFAPGRHVIRWRQSKTTGDTLHKKVVVKLFAPVNNRLRAGDNSVLDTVREFLLIVIMVLALVI
jgi:hypothetical protein